MPTGASTWIKGLRLGNFKAIGRTQAIPLRPITLVFGPNSAGKSSLLHGLLLAHHAMHSKDEAPLDAQRVELGGDSVDLGGFKQYVHRHQVESKVTWSAEVSLLEVRKRCGKEKGSTPLKRLCDIAGNVDTIRIDLAWGVETDDIGRAKVGALPRVVSYELLFDEEELLRASRRPHSGMRIDALAHEHPVIAGVIEAALLSSTTTSTVSAKDQQAIDGAVAEILGELTITAKSFLPYGVKRPDEDAQKMQQLSLFPVSKGTRGEDLAKAVRFWLPRILDELIRGVYEAVAQQFAQMRYLGPLRSYPPRHLAFAENRDLNWYAGGGHAWDVVLKNDDVRKKVNSWLGDRERLQTPYRLEIREHTTLENLRALLTKAVSDEQEKQSSIQEKLVTLESRLAADEADVETLREFVQVEAELNELSQRYDEAQGHLEDLQTRIYSANLEASIYDELMNQKAHHEQVMEEATKGIREADARLAATRRQFNAPTLRRGSFEAEPALVRLEESVSQRLREVDSLREKIAEIEGQPLADRDAGEIAASLFDNILASDPESLRELILMDLRSNSTVSHRDVGIGVSQVLPVLVAAYAGHSQTLIIEQPEIHLHPRLQAELGDVFIESALGVQRNTFILETHSEHLILRLMRRMRNTSDAKLPDGLPPIRPEDVAILYVCPQESGESVILHLRLDEEGALLDPWPGGFFEEGFRERFS